MNTSAPPNSSDVSGRDPSFEHTPDQDSLTPALRSRRPSATPTGRRRRFASGPSGTAPSRGARSPRASPRDFKKGDSARARRGDAHQQLREGRRQAPHHRAARRQGRQEPRHAALEERGAPRRRRARGRERQSPRQRHRHDAPQRRHDDVVNGKDARGLAQRHAVGQDRRGRARHQGRRHASPSTGRFATAPSATTAQERKLSAIDCRQFQVLERSSRPRPGAPAREAQIAPRRRRRRQAARAQRSRAARASNAECNPIGRTRAL